MEPAQEPERFYRGQQALSRALREPADAAYPLAPARRGLAVPQPVTDSAIGGVRPIRLRIGFNQQHARQVSARARRKKARAAAAAAKEAEAPTAAPASASASAAKPGAMARAGPVPATEPQRPANAADEALAALSLIEDELASNMFSEQSVAAARLFLSQVAADVFSYEQLPRVLSRLADIARQTEHPLLAAVILEPIDG